MSNSKTIILSIAIFLCVLCIGVCVASFVVFSTASLNSSNDQVVYCYEDGKSVLLGSGITAAFLFVVSIVVILLCVFEKNGYSDPAKYIAGALAFFAAVLGSLFGGISALTPNCFQNSASYYSVWATVCSVFSICIFVAGTSAFIMIVAFTGGCFCCSD